MEVFDVLYSVKPQFYGVFANITIHGPSIPVSMLIPAHHSLLIARFLQLRDHDNIHSTWGGLQGK